MTKRWMAGALIAAGCGLWAQSARAHTFLGDPAPRDAALTIAMKDGHKTGPCGGVAKANPTKNYNVGQQITVQFYESINHIGCFQLALSTDNDTTFTVLKQVDDADDGTIDRNNPRVVSTTVQLPQGVSCTNCTLQLRQLMLSSEQPPRNIVCPMNPQPIGTTPTYFSCADISIGGGAGDGGTSTGDGGTSNNDAGTNPQDDGGGPIVSGDGGNTGGGDSGTGGGGNRSNPKLADTGGDGCSISSANAPSLALPMIGAVALLGMLRRRKRR